MAQSIVTLRVDTTNATAALQGVQNKTNKLEKAFGGLRTAIAGIGVTVLAKQAVQTASNFEKLNVRLGLLTKANGTFAKSQQIAADAQKAFGLSATEALEGITDITARLQPLGVGVEDIKSTFFGFNTAAKLAGASTIEASNAFRQLAQALGSGRLAGDEFRSISEQIPTLLQPIAKELDVPIGKLKELAADGELTSDVVLRALRKIETDGAASLKELVANDPTQVFKDLSNASEDLSRAVGELLVPAVIPAVKGLTELTKAAVDFVNSPIGQASLIIGGIALAAQGLPVLLTAVSVGLTKVATAGGLAAVALNAIPFVAIATGLGLITTQLIKQANAQRDLNKLIAEGSKLQVSSAIQDLGIQAATEIANINRAEESGNKRAKQAAEQRLAIIMKQLRPLEKRFDTIVAEEAAANKIVKTKNEQKLTEEGINKILTDNLEKLQAIEEAEMNLVDKKGSIIDKLSRERELLNAKLNGNYEEVRLKQEIDRLVESTDEGMRDIITKYLEGNSELQKQVDLLDDAGDSADKLKGKFAEITEELGSGIVQNLTDAVMGTQTLAQAAINVLEKMRRKLIEVAIQKSLAGIAGSIGGPIGTFLQSVFPRANGGRVSANQPYMVGERGREMFVPTTSGTIVPNNQLGGGTTNVINVKVDASGTQAEGDEASSSQLGKLIGLAVQQELVKQSRAGGLLSRA